MSKGRVLLALIERFILDGILLGGSLGALYGTLLAALWMSDTRGSMLAGTCSAIPFGGAIGAVAGLLLAPVNGLAAWLVSTSGIAQQEDTAGVSYVAWMRFAALIATTASLILLLLVIDPALLWWLAIPIAIAGFAASYAGSRAANWYLSAVQPASRLKADG